MCGNFGPGLAGTGATMASAQFSDGSDHSFMSSLQVGSHSDGAKGTCAHDDCFFLEGVTTVAPLAILSCMWLLRYLTLQFFLSASIVSYGYSPLGFVPQL